MNFEFFNFHHTILSAVRDAGYTIPTPIQEKSIPPVLQGRDVIGLAQTGTGKTAAFALPVLQCLLTAPPGRVGALVISPTRELAEQTCATFTKLGKHTRLRSVAVYGGVGMSEQNRDLRAGAEIVTACPGRLLDHLWKGSIDLSNLKILVIDEADRMFDMGFLPSIKNILKCIMTPRQTLLFSATMPDEIRSLVKEILHNPVTIQIGQTLPAESVSHSLYPVEAHLKTLLLKEILKKTETDSVVVFTRTKRRTERVADQLARAGHRVASLQGDMLQRAREAAINGFRNGSFKILVATDIAARGLDISRISHVINFDMPESTDDYIHRIGRTGRVNKTGDAFTLVTSEDVRKIQALEKLLHTRLERQTLEGFDYGRPAPPPVKTPAKPHFTRTLNAKQQSYKRRQGF